MASPSLLARDEDTDEDDYSSDPRTPLFQPVSLPSIPEVELDSPLSQVQKADLLHHQVILHNLNEAWKGAWHVKDVALLAMTTLRTLQSRREMLLHPTKKEKEDTKQKYLDVID